MGITLTGLTPATTYDALIKTGDNEPLTASLKVLSDGVGTNLPMEASTTGINFTGTAQVGGVGIANTTQVAAKQDLLVSGTNIKTINSTSILGSGNIAVVTSPSGVAGAIQFSNGSAFASDAANFFWDDTNNRLGILTNAPTANIHNTGTTLLTQAFGSTSSLIVFNGRTANDATVSFGNGSGDNLYFGGSGLFVTGNTTLGNGTTTLSARLGIKGSGSTSATTSLLVQNSAGAEAFRVRDDKKVVINNNGILDITYDLNIIGTSGADCGILINSFGGSAQASLVLQHSNANYFKITSDRGTEKNTFFSKGIATMTLDAVGSVGIGTTSPNASSLLDITSTTKGVLFPRMTTTQKNAIATPAAGLVVYDNTTNKLQCYNGSTWNDLF